MSLDLYKPTPSSIKDEAVVGIHLLPRATILLGQACREDPGGIGLGHELLGEVLCLLPVGDMRHDLLVHEGPHHALEGRVRLYKRERRPVGVKKMMRYKGMMRIQ